MHLMIKSGCIAAEVLQENVSGWQEPSMPISHCECTNDRGAMRHHCSDNSGSCKIMPALFSCNDPEQQFPLDEENPIIIYFRYSSSTIFAHSGFQRRRIPLVT